MTEPASVMAARQLAEEARSRRAKCAPSAAPGPRGRRPLHTRRIRTALVTAAAAATVGCDGPVQACPAIGWASALVVELGDDWPAGADRTVEVDCDPACSPPVLEVEEASPVPLPGMPGTPAAPVPTPRPEPTPAPDPVVAVDGSGQAVLQLYAGWPDEVTVRVLEDGDVVAELTARPEFVRVDGTEDCGGNSEARVVVPAP